MISTFRIMSVIPIAAMLCLATANATDIATPANNPAYVQQERVAIIQTLDNNDSIGFQDLAYLTDKLRETAVNVLPKEQYGVMTTESIIAFLGSQEQAVKACNESSCLAVLGRKVNADYVAQGRIGRFNNNLTIKVELYDSKKGNLISSFIGESKDIAGLRDIINEKAYDLFKKMLGTPPSVAVELQQQQAAIPTNIPTETKKSEDSGLGWSGITRIAFWTVAGIFGAATIYKHLESKDRLKELDYLKTPSADIDEWKRQYNAKADEIREKENQRNIFGALTGVCVLSGVVTFFF
ncbi:MAG: hypothetical protein LBC75_02195 [Fibromonadaceae bacterium]|jgi:TolB-like protein|nr:hypothetical protein [Fibromonadaceae bacterium]